MLLVSDYFCTSDICYLEYETRLSHFSFRVNIRPKKLLVWRNEGLDNRVGRVDSFICVYRTVFTVVKACARVLSS